MFKYLASKFNLAPPSALTDVSSKYVVLLLFRCLLLFPLFLFFLVWSLFCYVVFSVLASFTLISLRKGELVTLLLLSS